MSDIIVLAAFLVFSISLFPGRQKKYAATCGWTLIVINLVSEVPAYFRAENFLYPALAFASLPFLAVTVRQLLRDDPRVLQLSRFAAVTMVIYVPFAFIPVVRDGLIRAVVNQAFWIITALGHHPQMPAPDIITENGFANQIILGCTGITAMSIMGGVIAGIPRRVWKLRVFASFSIIPLLYLLNLLRVAIVFIAVSDAWFRYLPNLTGNPGIGAADFFWAHNVFAEALACIVLIVIITGLFRVLPELEVFARGLADLYIGSLATFFRRGCG